ncbi:Trk system potassium transporter TrkA [Halovenus marina]|uniref:Trk system potassium transporter TrkA n=1 Tax=Halovenus marina TaxID=3396621 RepID=UPI003F54A8AC
MDVVIVGAGEVGTTIAENFASEHNVVVIDVDETRVEELKYQADVMTLAGDGTSHTVLDSVDAGDADLFLACTDDDQTNIISCGTAKTLGDPFTIARTRSDKYFNTWEQKRGAFGVDFLVCTELLTAENIVRVIGLPSAVDVDPFAGGLVQMAEFEIDENSPIAGKTVAEADHFESLTFAGLFRDGEMIIAKGSTRIQPGDRTVVIGSPESVQGFAMDSEPGTTPDTTDEIVIIGGSEIGYHVAKLLEDRGLRSVLIEKDSDRARTLAEELPDTLVMEHDATDTDFLAREHVDEADYLVSALRSDEQNLLTSMLAKRLGCRRVVSVVENAEYVELFEEIGVDVAINPRQVTAEEIIRFSFESVAENLAVLENDRAEVVELELTADSELVGRSIQELATELDGSFVIGAISRDFSLVIPRGETTLEPGDHVVIFAESSFVSDLTAMQ